MDVHPPIDRLTFCQFAKLYMRETFYGDWKAEQTDLLDIIESLASGQVLRAAIVKRGIGTTSLFKAAAVWAILRRLHRDVLLLLDTQAVADEVAENVCNEFACNTRIAERFGHFKATRQNGNVAIYGTAIDAVIVARGIHCSFCGIATRTSLGNKLRPSLVLIDVPMPHDGCTPPSVVERTRQIIENEVLCVGHANGRMSAVIATHNSGIIPRWAS